MKRKKTGGAKKKLTIAQIKEAIKKYGSITKAAKNLKVSYSTIWKDVHNNEELLAFFKDTKNKRLDMLIDYATDNVLQALIDGSFAATKFVLIAKCGWGKTKNAPQEKNVEDNIDNNELAKLTEEARRARLEELHQKFQKSQARKASAAA